MRTITPRLILSPLAATKVLLACLIRRERQRVEGSACMFAVTEGLLGRTSARTVIDSLTSYDVYWVRSPLRYHLGVVVCLG